MYSLCLDLLLCFLPFFGLGKHNTHTASFLFNNSKCFLSNKISIFPRFPILVFISCNLTFGYTKLPILKKLYLLFLKEHIFIKFFCQFAKVCHGFEEKNSLYHYFLQLYSTFTPWSLSLAKNQFHQPFGLKTAHFPISYNNYENNYFPPFIMF